MKRNRGHKELTDHFALGRGTWAEGGCEPETVYAQGNKVVVDLVIRVRLKGQEEWLNGRIGDGFVIRNGLVVEMQSFETVEEGLAWAGLSAKDRFERS